MRKYILISPNLKQSLIFCYEHNKTTNQINIQEIAMDPLFTSLTTAAAKATASEITTRVKAAKANNNKDQTIEELTGIITDLNESRGTLLLIAQSLKEKLVAQQINDDEINYIVETIIPKVESILQSEEGISKSAKSLEQIKPILSEDTLKVLQTLGFNYRKAIGEPLTQIVRDWILSKTESNNRKLELEILKEQNYKANFELIGKDDYSDRLKEMQETYKTFHS